MASVSHDQNFKNLILDYPRVNLPNMRVPEGRRVEAYAAAVRGLLALETDADRRAKYMEFIDIYAGLGEDEYRRYESEFAEESKAMTGMIQRARDEGRREGKQEGKREGRNEGVHQGRVEGERAVLERLLRRRFGLLPPGVVERLRRASADDLETWADNVLDATALNDVFATSG